ncbi:unnamed protein product, partial [Amoebophrya sp. A120]
NFDNFKVRKTEEHLKTLLTNHNVAFPPFTHFHPMQFLNQQGSDLLSPSLSPADSSVKTMTSDEPHQASMTNVPSSARPSSRTPSSQNRGAVLLYTQTGLLSTDFPQSFVGKRNSEILRPLSTPQSPSIYADRLRNFVIKAQSVAQVDDFVDDSEDEVDLAAGAHEQGMSSTSMLLDRSSQAGMAKNTTSGDEIKSEHQIIDDHEEGRGNGDQEEEEQSEPE